MKKVTIDVGHSATDGGAINKTYNVSEFEYNSGLARSLSKELKAKGFKVEIVLRESYSKLPAQINATNCDICISLHCNAFNQIASGTEVLYWHSSTKGKKLASILQDNIVGCLGLRDRGIKPLEGNSRGGSQLRKTTMPTVIVESGFIDNDIDYMILEDNVVPLAKSIAEGVVEYFN